MRTFSSRQDCLDAVESRLASEGDRIPHVQEAVAEVKKSVGKANVGAKDLAEDVLSDPAMTAKVLKMANSVYHGISDKEIKTVTTAIVLIGFEKIRSLIMGNRVLNMLNNMPGSQDQKRVWAHSVTCGVCAQQMAKKLKLQMPEQAFVAGILVDIGQTVLRQFFPDEYGEVDRLMAKEGLAETEAERRVFKCTHADVGELVAEKWEFPKQVSYAIRRHEIDRNIEHVSKTPNFLCKTIMISDQLAAHVCGQNGRNVVPMERIRKACQESLRIKSEDLDSILTNVSKQVEDIASALDINLSKWRQGDPEKKVAVSPVRELPEKTRFETQEEIDAKFKFIQLSTEKAATTEYLTMFLYQTVAKLCEIIKLRYFFLLTFRPETNSLKAIYANGKGSQELKDRISVGLESIDEVASCAYTRGEESILSPRTQAQFSREGKSDLSTMLATRHIAALPVKVGDETRAVVIGARPSMGPEIDQDDLRVLKVYADNVATILRKKSDPQDFS